MPLFIQCALSLVLLGAVSSAAAPPRVPLLRWVDLKSETATVNAVSAGLSGETYTHLREIGVFQDAALAIVSLREKREDQYVPFDYDSMEAFSCSISKRRCNHIWGGYKFQVVGAAMFASDSEVADLVFTYDSCTECEQTTLISAFSYDPKSAEWKPRSWGKKDYPGLPVSYDVIEGAGDGVYAIYHFDRSGTDEIGIWLKESGEGKTKNTYTIMSVKNGLAIQRELKRPSDISKFKKALCTNDMGATGGNIYTMCAPYRLR